MNLRTAIVLLAIAICPSVFAQDSSFEAMKEQIKIVQRLGNTVPSDAKLRDEEGRTIRFGDLLGKRPLIVMPMFFTCKGVCGLEADGLLRAAIRIREMDAGKDYDIVMLSVNPQETPELAKAKRNSAVAMYDRPGAATGWHFLTGELGEVRKVTDALGFGFQYVPGKTADDARINHSAGIMVVTPQGKVSQYFLGADFVEQLIIKAVNNAKNEGIGLKSETILMGCISIDPATHKRSLVVRNVANVAIGFTAVCLFTWIGFMSFKHRRSPLDTPPGHEGGPLAG